jgi:hypothetical protein
VIELTAYGISVFPNELRTKALSSVKLFAGRGRSVTLSVKYPNPVFAGSPKSWVTVTEFCAKTSPEGPKAVSVYIAVP